MLGWAFGADSRAGAANACARMLSRAAIAWGRWLCCGAAGWIITKFWSPAVYRYGLLRNRRTALRQSVQTCGWRVADRFQSWVYFSSSRAWGCSIFPVFDGANVPHVGAKEKIHRRPRSGLRGTTTGGARQDRKILQRQSRRSQMLWD